jgi:hypothetical protein
LSNPGVGLGAEGGTFRSAASLLGVDRSSDGIDEKKRFARLEGHHYEWRAPVNGAGGNGWLENELLARLVGHNL